MATIDLLTILGSSIMAFVLGVFMGVALGWNIWAIKKSKNE